MEPMEPMITAAGEKVVRRRREELQWEKLRATVEAAMEAAHVEAREGVQVALRALVMMALRSEGGGGEVVDAAVLSVCERHRQVKASVQAALTAEASRGAAEHCRHLSAVAIFSSPSAWSNHRHTERACA